MITIHDYTLDTALPEEAEGLDLSAHSNAAITDDVVDHLPPSSRLRALALPPRSALSAQGLARLARLRHLKARVKPEHADALDDLPALQHLTTPQDLLSGKKAPRLPRLQRHAEAIAACDPLTDANPAPHLFLPAMLTPPGP